MQVVDNRLLGLWLFISVSAIGYSQQNVSTIKTDEARNGVCKTHSQIELSDEQVEDIVTRCYPYVAMYNIIHKAGAKRPWNSVSVRDRLTDHTARSIKRPNNDFLVAASRMDMRNDAVVVYWPTFDSEFVCLETSAYDHYCRVPFSSTRGDFAKPGRVLFYSARTKGYAGEPVDGVDEIIELSGDFAIAFFRVMPHASERDRMKRNVAAMREIKFQTLAAFQDRQVRIADETDFPTSGSNDELFESNLIEVMQFVVNHTTFDAGDKLDAGLFAALKRLGVEPGKTFDPKIAKTIDGKALAAAARRIDDDARATWAKPDNPYMYEVFRPKGEMKLKPMVIQSATGPLGLPADQSTISGCVRGRWKTNERPTRLRHSHVKR